MYLYNNSRIAAAVLVAQKYISSRLLIEMPEYLVSPQCLYSVAEPEYYFFICMQ